MKKIISDILLYIAIILAIPSIILAIPSFLVQSLADFIYTEPTEEDNCYD